MSLLNRIDRLLEEYWGSRGAGILPIAKDTGRILVAMRSPYVQEPNTYGVWGGAIDSDEKPEKAAEREFDEETGFRGPMKMIPAYKFKDGSFTYHNFLGIVDSEFNPRLNWETASYKWITFEELVDLRPKHFGLKLLLKHSGTLIQKHTETGN